MFATTRQFKVLTQVICFSGVFGAIIPTGLGGLVPTFSRPAVPTTVIGTKLPVATTTPTVPLPVATTTPTVSLPVATTTPTISLPIATTTPVLNTALPIGTTRPALPVVGNPIPTDVNNPVPSFNTPSFGF